LGKGKVPRAGLEESGIRNIPDRGGSAHRQLSYCLSGKISVTASFIYLACALEL
jgi:hypothetical protein